MLKSPRMSARDARSEPLVDMLLALADTTRLRILNLLSEGELCVCYFVDLLGVSQPKVSRHLAYLRRARLVASRRDGKWVHYRLVEPDDAAAATLLRAALDAVAHDPEMERDRHALVEACCSLRIPAPLRKLQTPDADSKAP